MIPKNPKPTPREGLMVAIPSSEYNSLCGRFTYFLFQPLLREMIPFDSYVSNGLVQPPPRIWMIKMATSHDLLPSLKLTAS